MQITIITDNSTHLEDIERVFRDSRATAIERKRKYFLDLKTLPAGICNINDENTIFVTKKEIK